MKYALTLAAILLTVACGPDQRIIDSAKENEERTAQAERSSNEASAVRAASSFEGDVEAMWTADFNFVYVIRRKDREILDDGDKTFIRENVPYEINRTKISDMGRAVILGSNFKLPPESLKSFKDRFQFEEMSKPETAADAATPDNDGRR